MVTDQSINEKEVFPYELAESIIWSRLTRYRNVSHGCAPWDLKYHAERGVEWVIERTLEDLHALQDGGVDA